MNATLRTDVMVYGTVPLRMYWYNDVWNFIRVLNSDGPRHLCDSMDSSSAFGRLGLFTIEALSYLRLPALASSGLVVALTGLLYAKQKYDLIPLKHKERRERLPWSILRMEMLTSR